MKNRKTFSIWLLSIVGVLSLISIEGHAQSLSEAKKLCGNLTAANRALAAKAGYDVDKVCGEVTAVSAAKKAVEPPPKVARKTVSEAPKKVATKKPAVKPETLAVAVAPVAVAGVGAPAPTSTLKPFGYDLFANAPSTYAPAASIPVSADYMLGPGDTLDILFYGKTNNAFSLEINREGFVDFPELGPVGLAGMTYAEAKEMLQTRIATQIVGTKVSISMGSLRSMQIFVLGEAFKPGAYTVSSLSTITHALVSSGGVNDIGSLRNIQLKRQGQVVATLDLYDLLLNGDTSNDERVQAADVIYIPTVGDLVSIEGQVLRPAIYELKGDESIKDLVALAGGMGPKAFASSATIRRIDGTGFMTVLDVDLSTPDDLQKALKDGDHLRIGSIINENKSVVTLTGHIYHPGQFAYKEGMRVSDLLAEMGEHRPGLDLSYAMITRTDPTTGYLSAVQVKLSEILNNTEVDANIILQDKDTLRLFAMDGNRAGPLSGLVAALTRQKRADELPAITSVSGARLSGTFPITEGMRISDLVAAAGGVTPNYADLDYSVLVREELSDMSEIKVLPINLRGALERKGGADDYLIQPKDQLVLFSINEDRPSRLAGIVSRLNRQVKLDNPSRTVSVSGGVRFAGAYPLTEGMSIKDLINAAGGFNELTDLEYSLLVREDPSENNEIKVLPINLGKALADKGRSDNHLMQPRDRLVVFSINGDRPSTLAGVVGTLRAQAKLDKTPRVVTANGTVRFPGTYPLTEGMTVKDLISAAGGFRESAYRQSAEIARIDLSNPERATSGVVLSRLSGSQDRTLQPSDRVQFRTIPEFGEVQSITLEGEFVFPGTYDFERGETLTSVIERAGGFTKEAFVDGSIFLREELRAREQEEIQRLMRALEDDINANRLRDVNSDIEVDESKLAVQRNAIASLSSQEASGRLVIPLSDIVAFASEDVILKDNDRLLIPKFSQEVTIIGEVQRPTSYLFDPSFSKADYIDQSGGMKQRADKRAVYVVKAGGEVIMPKLRLFSFGSKKSRIGPGDTIVVPLDTDDTRIKGLPLLAEVSTIIYQLALGSAAIKSFNNNP